MREKPINNLWQWENRWKYSRITHTKTQNVHKKRPKKRKKVRVKRKPETKIMARKARKKEKLSKT